MHLTGDYYVYYSIPAVLDKLVAKLDKRANHHNGEEIAIKVPCSTQRPKVDLFICHPSWY